MLGAQLRLSVNGGNCLERLGYVFPTFPNISQQKNGEPELRTEFSKLMTDETVAMMTEGEGPQHWAMGISCVPTGTRRRPACEK